MLSYFAFGQHCYDFNIGEFSTYWEIIAKKKIVISIEINIVFIIYRF